MREQHDAASHRQHHGQADPGAGALRPRGGRSQQVADPAGEDLEVPLVDAGSVRRRVRLQARGNCRQSVGPVRVQPEPAGDPAQPGHGERIRCDDAEEFREGTAAGLRITGKDLALGGPVAVRDDQRADLGPQEDPAAQLAQRVGIQPAGSLLVDATVPDEAADDCEPGEEQHQAHPRARGDRARSALDGHGRGQVEGPRVREPSRLGQEILQGLSANPALAAPADLEVADPRPRPLAVHDRLEVVQRGVDAPHEGRRQDAGTHVLERLVELLCHRGREHVVVGQGVTDGRPPLEPLRRHGPTLRLLRHGCNRQPVDLPVRVIGPVRAGCHYGVAIWGWQGSVAVLPDSGRSPTIAARRQCDLDSTWRYGGPDEARQRCFPSASHPWRASVQPPGRAI